MRDRRGLYRVFVGGPAGSIPLGRPRLRWGIILKWVCYERDGEEWTELIWLRIETGGGRL
jgi:hypothetical protein